MGRKGDMLRSATELHLSGFVFDISSEYHVEIPSPPAATISPSSPYVGMHPVILRDFIGNVWDFAYIP